MKAIFQTFAELLDQRLACTVPTTEDSVRYTLFAAMLNHGIKPNQVVLEYPHPVIPRALIDTWIQSDSGQSVAIEFKYDRDPPSGKNQPKTQKAGSVFHDLHRLLRVQMETNTTCYFVYVTTAEMAVYFKNPANGYHSFFALKPGETLDITSGYFASKPMTFMNRLGGEFEARVTGVCSRALAASHALRVFQAERL